MLKESPCTEYNRVRPDLSSIKQGSGSPQHSEEEVQQVRNPFWAVGHIQLFKHFKLNLLYFVPLNAQMLWIHAGLQRTFRDMNVNSKDGREGHGKRRHGKVEQRKGPMGSESPSGPEEGVLGP